MEPFRILALSGGGFRGLYTIRVLKLLEEKTGVRIRDQFDLIAGTSIGGILALGLAAGKEVEELESLFVDRGKEIFKARWPFAKKVSALSGPMYGNKGLKKVLKGTFGDKKMGDLKGPSVLVPACNVTTGRPKMFKTQHNPEFYIDREFKLVDVALATSAAPIYFPVHNIPDQGYFSDGALVGNAPGGFALDEAEQYMGQDRQNISLLAIGTLSGKFNLSNAGGTDKSAIQWVNPSKDIPILQMIMSQAEQVTNFMLTKKLGARYAMIDSTVTTGGINDIALDAVGKESIDRLKAHAKEDFTDFVKKPFMTDHLTNATSADAQ